MSDHDKPTQVRTARALAAVAMAELFPTLAREVHADELKGRLVNLLLSLFRAADKPTRDWLLDLVPVLEGGAHPHPPELIAWLRNQIGHKGLEAWVRTHSGLPAKELAGSGPRKLVAHWLSGSSGTDLEALLSAGARFRIQNETPADRTAIQASFQRFTGKEMNMATTSYYFDSRGLPPGLDTVAYEAAVATELKGSFGLDRVGNEERFAAIVGMMLLDEQFAPSAFGFRDALQKVWVESLGKTLHYDGTEVPNNEIYKEVAADIVTFPGHTNGKISFQEFASVDRYVIEGAKDVPLGHPNFATQVRIGLDRFVAGAPPSDSLILPSFTEDGAGVEIEADNVRAVGTVLAGLNCERTRLFHVLDRVTELFMQGMLPIGFDNSGKALDAYHWDSEDRLSEPARRMLYARVLGAPGADVSKEVQPNREFDGLFLRFLSSLAEYDRQRRIGDLFDANRRTLTLTGEQVRKTGRDLGANASLYGWGGTHFAARRLNAHLTRALDILKMPQIQKAYGVSNPWQVIERVAASEFGAAPNIVKYRTMAESGKAILDLVAKHAKAWSASTGRPLFTDDVTRVPGDIPTQDQEELMRHTQYWLAVNGIGDDQVGKMSQPSDTSYAPSIPAYGGVGTPGAGGAGGDAMEKIKQMVQTGSAPSIDQLKQMFPM
jgi:hypothetical protein